MRRTKMVCTLGPSSSSPDIIRQLIAKGMDVARLNCSHGVHDDHRRLYNAVRTAAKETGRTVAVLLDLQGPKIRTGSLAVGGPVQLSEGERFIITANDVPGDEHCVSTTYKNLPYDVKSGDRLLLADGAMELHVERVAPPKVFCRIVRGGYLGEHKGINLPGVAVSAPSLTDKDVNDLAFGLKLGVDYVALSFVRAPGDVRQVKQRVRAAEGAARVIAKIERPEAVEHFDAVLEEADAVMVARGDLGVEMPLDSVPQIQKALIAKCNAAGKPVITATQMLESMIASTRPTRAEVSDVANAIYDGTDAVMLSGETAAGRYPLAAAACMASVAEKADAALAQTRRITNAPALHGDDLGAFSVAIGKAVAEMTSALDIKRIVCFTQSGYTAAAMARFRPPAPITAITLSEETRRRTALYWGVDAVEAVEAANVEQMMRAVDQTLIERHLAHRGDTICVVAGTPLAIGGRTNLLKLHRVGDRF